MSKQEEYTEEYWDKFFEEADTSEIERRIAAIKVKQEKENTDVDNIDTSEYEFYECLDEKEEEKLLEESPLPIGLVTPVVDEKFKDKAQDIDFFIATNRTKLRTIYNSTCDIFGGTDEGFESWLSSEECFGVVTHFMSAPVNIIDSISPTPNVNECSFSDFDSKVLELSDKMAEIMDIVMKEARKCSFGVDYHSRVIDKLLKKFTYQVKAYNEEIKLQEEFY